MQKEASLELPERRSSEDIADYMAFIQMALSVDHRKLSPLCMSQTMEYCKMPADSDQGIGFAIGGNA